MLTPSGIIYIAIILLLIIQLIIVFPLRKRKCFSEGASYAKCLAEIKKDHPIKGIILQGLLLSSMGLIILMLIVNYL